MKISSTSSLACVPLVVVAVSGLLLGGCREPSGDVGVASANEPQEVELFDKNKGVKIPEGVREALQVEVAEVVSEARVPSLRKAAQVYRTASGRGVAEAVLWWTRREASLLESMDGRVVLAGGDPVMSLRTEDRITARPGYAEWVVEVADAGEGLLDGAFIEVLVRGSKPRDVLMVPSSAVIHGVEGGFVYTVNGEHLVRTPVTLGSDDGDQMEVLDGLFEGDIVVTRAPNSLWLVELCALRGGTPCCAVETKPKRD